MTPTHAERIDDDYPTCAQTYATLRIYHQSLDPEEISRKLDLQPTDSWSAGTTLSSPQAGSAHGEYGGWLLETEGVVASRDVRRHLWWLIERLESRRNAIASLQEAGYEIDVTCYWLSAAGHGGPTLDPPIMGRLAELQLDLVFDIYLADQSVILPRVGAPQS